MVVLLSCADSKPVAITPITDHSNAATPTTEDGRLLVLDDERWWCYANEEMADGGCGDSKELCELLRAKQIEWWTFKILGNVPKEQQTKEQWLAYWNLAAKDFPACTQWPAYACFETTKVLTGQRYTLCWPYLSACDRRLFGQRNEADLKPIGDRCSIHRGR